MILSKVNIRKWLVQIKWSLETSLMLAVARFLIKFIPFRYWRWTLGDFENSVNGHVNTEVFNPVRAAYIGRWVRRTAQKMPFEAVCLPQAMACRWMLARRGLPSKVFIGAKKEKNKQDTLFHAWLMHGELCLTGQNEKDNYMKFSKS